MPRTVLPRWMNSLKVLIPVLVVGGGAWAVVFTGLGASPRTTDTRYQPEQPVPYSHALHAGELGIDCRYCHNTVEWTAAAAVPPTQTCMNCHQRVRTESVQLVPVLDSNRSGMPVQWVRVHALPDYAYFNHSIHVQAGVSCFTCHGRVDVMPVVYQAESLSMGWCLDCHRDPAPHLRPPEAVTDPAWVPAEDPRALGERLMLASNISPRTDCTTCHR